jgi:hypothetical protein
LVHILLAQNACNVSSGLNWLDFLVQCDHKLNNPSCGYVNQESKAVMSVLVLVMFNASNPLPWLNAALEMF